jgi:hypothetical protein
MDVRFHAFLTSEVDGNEFDSSYDNNFIFHTSVDIIPLHICFVGGRKVKRVNL